LACLSTQGPSTDGPFRASAGASLEYASDRDEFARKCSELVSDPARRRALGTGARSFYEANFSWRSIADRYLLLADRVS
jgi:glycosyltransferase involved in cell wall biosynthesis